MSENNSWKPDEDDDEEELDETGYKTVKDAVIFAIEVSETMLTPPLPTGSKKDDKDSPTTAALKCAYALMQQRIISNPNDMIGILLFGTEMSKFQGERVSRGSIAYPHCYLLIDLDVPAAEDVKTLKTLANDDDDDSKEILKPSTEVVSMSNLLFCANQIFTTKASNFSSRRLFIVTDNDNPHATDKATRASSAVRAKDLYDLGVTIELFPISKPDQLFDRSKFYDDIIYNSTPSDPEASALVSNAIANPERRDGISLLQSLLSSINSKTVPKRSLFSNLRFEIGPGFIISVSGYIIFKRQEPKRSHYVYLGGEKAQIVTGETTRTADDTARVVDKAEIKKAYKFGGDQIVFTSEEAAQLRQFGDPVIRIIGFKPSSMLPVWANLRPSTFIYPSEEDFVGSTRVFAALHQKLLDSHKVALAWYIARKNAGPQVTAIVPGTEIVDESGNQTMPAGLWICPLPFADDIRQNPEQRLIRAPEPLIDLMRDVIQQLQLPKAIYDPQRYPNPALQWHYRILQAMALEEDIPDHPDDKTIPKYKQIDKRAGPYITSWGRELESQHSHYEKNSSHPSSSLPVGSKRPAPASSATNSQVASSATKRAKIADSGLNDSAMKLIVDGGDLSKLKVADLKSWLQPKGFEVSNKKKVELMAQVEQFFEKR